MARPLELRRTSGGGGRKTLFTFRPGHVGSRGGGDSMSIKGSGPECAGSGTMIFTAHSRYYFGHPSLERRGVLSDCTS